MKIFCLISLIILTAGIAVAGEWGSFNGTLINYSVVKHIQNNCTALIPRIDVYTKFDTKYKIKYPTYRTCVDGYSSIVKWMNENGK